MEYDVKTPQWNTSDRNSFAYPSARDRWPVIITQGIDDIHRATYASEDPELQKEGKEIVQELAKLKYELQHDRQLNPLVDDGEPDIPGYNKELESRGQMNWFNAPWLYSECYMYRRIAGLFALSSKWKNYDIYGRQKIDTFRSSRAAVVELAAKYKELVTELETAHTLKGVKSEAELIEAEKILFIEMCEICLWGNATDLSLLTNVSFEDIQKLQGSKARKAAEDKILVNRLPDAFAILSEAKKSGKSERRVDFVLDNAGFELFVDLILAGYLLAAGLATTVVLHPKSIPWFVSDVIPKDFMELLGALADPQKFYTTPSDDDKHAERTLSPLSEKEVEELLFLYKHWGTMHAEGRLLIRPNRFWTEGGSFWRMPNTAPDLFEDLKNSELVIFKGDLNYRKLLGDAMWDPATPFADAIGPLGTNSGLRVLALRTCKGDAIVGLAPGEDEKMRTTPDGGADSGARKWAWKGKYAVIQFCNGKA